MKRVTKITIFAATWLSAVACAGSDATGVSKEEHSDALPVETGSSAVIAGEPAEVVATLSLENGSEISFLDLGDAQVGIGERAPIRAAFSALALVRNHNATPLEVFMALGPRSANAPDALVRDHELRTSRAGKAQSPRRLAAAPMTFHDINNPGREFYVCDGFGYWINDWKDAFVGITKYREAGYGHQLMTSYTFYPGAPVYYGTNTNSKTYLGACNGDAYTALELQIHRRISGQWTSVFTTNVDSYEKYTFYSGVPASYRARVQPDGLVVEHFGIGAAWTLSPPIGIAK